VAPHLVLALGSPSSSASWEWLALRRPTALKVAFRSFKFSNACQRQWTVRLTSILLASLLLLASVASATGAGPGSTSNQTNTSSSSASQGESDARDLELGKPIERELAGGQRRTYR
jgi:hypothetical protein